jgi:DNA-binding NarL/FixJ family response regulator
MPFVNQVRSIGARVKVDGIDVAAYVRRHLPTTEVLIFTTFEVDVFFREALAAGPRGLVLNQILTATWMRLLTAWLSIGPFFPIESQQHSSAVTLGGHRSKDVLTNRERSVAQLIAEGSTNRRIGAKLGIAIKTVETHSAAIMRKLNISSSVALVHYAVRNKLVDP